MVKKEQMTTVSNILQGNFFRVQRLGQCSMISKSLLILKFYSFPSSSIKKQLFLLTINYSQIMSHTSGYFSALLYVKINVTFQNMLQFTSPLPLCFRLRSCPCFRMSFTMFEQDLFQPKCYPFLGNVINNRQNEFLKHSTNVTSQIQK